MAPDGPEDKGYPPREKFFAHRLVRILTKDAVANELGSEVCWLITVIALQEDSKRYRGPVTYYNSQLAPLCGFTSDKALDRARNKAIKAGYLNYAPGRKGVAGKYWCLIPATVKDIPDGPCDETAEKVAGECPDNSRESDGASAEQVQSNSREKGDLSYLSLTPIPNPEEESTSDKPEDGLESSLAAHQVIVTEWNIVGPVKCQRLTAKRRATMAARLRDAWWRENWRKGLARIPDSDFLCGRSGAWKADIDWFLKPDSLTKILEGKYENGTSSKRTGGPVIGAGDRYDPEKPITASDFAR